MSRNKNIFQKFLDEGKPVGEVIAVNRFILTLKGIQPCNVFSLILFEDGSKGFVQKINKDSTIVLHLGNKPPKVGTLGIVQHDRLLTKVGKGFIGRIISVTGEPLDGKGPILDFSSWNVFNNAPNINQRELLKDQVETGVTVVDSLFPIVKGQRMALLGDSKSGKSSLATQMIINQKNTNQIVVYCLIAKKKADVDQIISRLSQNGGLDNSIIIVATLYDSLTINFLAPYVACSMAEYLWQEENEDVIIVYDDLSAHAQVHREISLLQGSSPGRDSYPGDTFYTHSRLLGRAGKLNKNSKCLTAIAIVNVSNGDITAYLPTNIMSITDGQWILDMNLFKDGQRPALNIGLSVTRAGGLGHNSRQKKLAQETFKILADYQEAKEFSHFGNELSDQSKTALYIGDLILELLNQEPTKVFSLIEQQLMLNLIIDMKLTNKLNIIELKQKIKQYASKILAKDDFEVQFQNLRNDFIGLSPQKIGDKA